MITCNNEIITSNVILTRHLNVRWSPHLAGFYPSGVDRRGRKSLESTPFLSRVFPPSEIEEKDALFGKNPGIKAFHSCCVIVYQVCELTDQIPASTGDRSWQMLQHSGSCDCQIKAMFLCVVGLPSSDQMCRPPPLLSLSLTTHSLGAHIRVTLNRCCTS